MLYVSTCYNSGSNSKYTSNSSNDTCCNCNSSGKAELCLAQDKGGPSKGGFLNKR